MDTTEDLQARIEDLEVKHRALDEKIQHLSETPPFDRIRIQRLKKEKLAIKDEITRLHALVLPDIIA